MKHNYEKKIISSIILTFHSSSSDHTIEISDNLKESSEDLKESSEDSKESSEDSKESIGSASFISRSEIRESESSIESEKENPIFEDLSEVNFSQGSRSEVGYYGFPADHEPSSSEGLISSKNKFTGEPKKRKSLCSVEGRKAKSVEKYYPKLIEYKSKIEV